MNITEIIKAQPNSEMKVWSPMLGECTASISADIESSYPITIREPGGFEAYLTAGGRYLQNEECECIVFPSKTQRDWGKVVVTHTYKPFERVLTRQNSDSPWRCDLFSHKESNGMFSTRVGSYNARNILPYRGNEDKAGRVTE